MRKLDTKKMADKRKAEIGETSPSARKKPDWREEGDYAYTENLSLKGWAWEALRRYEPYSEAFIESNKKPKNKKELAKQFSLSDMYDPSLPYSKGIKFISNSYPVLTHSFDDLEACISTFEEYSEETVSPILITPEQGVVVFDLTKDIQGQLKHAETLLKERQKLFEVIPENEKEPRIKISEEDIKAWLKHIRTLDALDENPNVKKADIAKYICDLESYDRDVTNESQKHYDIGREAIKAAKEFPEKYRKILFKGYREERLWYWYKKKNNKKVKNN